MLRRTLLGLLAASTVPSLAEGVPDPIPAGYHEIWSDEFKSLSLRTGGPTYNGLTNGTGTWATPGAWWSSDPRGIAGDGYEWMVNPTYYGWPPGYPKLGQFAITDDGLRLRVEQPSAAMAALLPKLHRMGAVVTPWITGQINSFFAVRIKPPFYFEARAKMPLGVGRPWPAIWLVTGAHKPYPADHGKEYEIDIHEGFGDSVNLHMTVHWNPNAYTHTFPSHDVAKGVPTGLELSADFNTWGCYVTKEKQIFYFNGREVGHMDSPPDALVDQPFGIIFGIGAGMPWKGGGPPSDGPHDMIVRYARLYAPDKSGLTLR
jgi:hypothetical protein